MSEKKNNNNTEQVKEKPEKKKLGKKGILAIILSSVALVGIITGIVFAVILSNQTIADYSKGKLSRYVYVPKELYESYNVTVDIPEITDEDVDEQIVKILRSFREPYKDEDGNDILYSLPNVNISAGDIAYIYYRGYTEEDGVKSYFDGGCNFADAEPYALDIGSGKFIPGFESALIGRNPDREIYEDKYASIENKHSGFVEDGDIVSITYSVMTSDTIKENKDVVIDLSDPDVDSRWGEGFRAFLIGKEIDSDKVICKLSDKEEFVCDGENGEYLYYNITIKSACYVDDTKPYFIVDVTFPTNYEAEELRGKDAHFEVYITGVQDYNIPEFNDAFVTDKIKMTAESLASYEGDTLAEKYKAYIKEALNLTRDQQILALKEDTFWKIVVEGAQFKKDLPEKEVRKYYDALMSELNVSFNYQAANTQYANDFDGFARYSLGLAADADWKAFLRQDAEYSVKEKLVFYYILKTEDLKPSKAEYQEIYEPIFNDHLQEYLDFYKITASDPDYEAKLKKAKEEVLDTYGEDYFKEQVYYNYVMGKVVENAVEVTP